MTPGSGPTPGWDRRLRVYLEVSYAAFRNAEALHRDSRALLRERLYPRAAALAVIGCEEIGKAMAFWLAGLGRVPESHLPELLKSLRSGRASHSSKQAISMVAWLIGDVLGKARPALRQVVRTVASQRVDAEPARVAGYREFVADAMRDLGPAAVALVDRHVGDWSRVEAQVNAVAAGSLQRVRDRALYVDFRDGKLSEPRSIRPQQARALVGELRVMLSGFRPLAPLTEWADEAVVALSGALPGLEDPEAIDRLWRDATQLAAKRAPGQSPSRRGSRRGKRPAAKRPARPDVPDRSATSQ